MKIIVPMAGMGKRMRPHTLTVPKPLVPIAGKPIVHRLVEDIASVSDEKVTEVAFIIGVSFGEEIEESLKQIASNIGAEAKIFYQEEALGTAHAILCAQDCLNEKVIVAFADTLFKADFKLDSAQDGVIWVNQIDDPSAFGVVKLNNANEITDFVEKPETFVSDLAIVGIYYFKDGEYLKNELQYLVDNNIMDKGEYQLTNALENMKNKGTKFVPGKLTEWLDCGNKNATVYTNQRYLEFIKNDGIISSSAKVENSTIIEPVYLGENVVIRNSVVGPHVSVGDGTKIDSSIVNNSIIQTNSEVKNANFSNSMLGNFAKIEGKSMDLSVGDYNTMEG